MESSNEVDVATPPPASHSDPPQASPGGGSNSQSHSPTRIPKKNNNHQPSMKHSANSSENENSIVLPNGVHLPSTVTPQMLEGRIRRAFLDLTPAQMRDVLQEYDDAVTQKGDEIRNRSAYFFGVVKRYKVAVDRSGGGGDFTPQGNTVSDRVQTRLDALISSGFCTASEIDAKIRDRIRMMPERDALDAIDELNGCSRKEIRNFASYFMGIMNKYMKGERNDPRSRGANRARNHRDGQKNNAANDDRFSHYGRNDDHASSARHRRDGRGDGRDRQSSMRDGDRDHNRSRRRSRSRSRSRSYDSRSRSQSPNYRRRRRSRSRSDSRDRHHSSRRHNRSSRDGSTRTSSTRDPNISSTYMIPPPPPPPQRPQTMMQPMTMGQQQQLLPGQPPQVMVHGLQRPMQPPQQQFVQSIGQIPQLGQDAQLNPYLQQYQQQLLQQQQFQQSVPGSNIPQHSLQHMQQMQTYNQNMQQLNQPGKMMPGNVPGLPNMMLGQQGPGSQPGNATNMYSVQNPDQQPLLDIFGIADKAAQALSGRLPQVNPAASVSTMSNPNFPPLLTPANLSAPAFQPHQQNTTSSRQQKATATESELPMMVQYAIQNLRTTGHIESSLDAPLIAMLQRLPENSALSALEIFSSCDLSKMRSKAAYLAGILKKELAKLGLQ